MTPSCFTVRMVLFFLVMCLMLLWSKRLTLASLFYTPYSTCFFFFLQTLDRLGSFIWPPYLITKAYEEFGRLFHTSHIIYNRYLLQFQKLLKFFYVAMGIRAAFQASHLLAISFILEAYPVVPYFLHILIIAFTVLHGFDAIFFVMFFFFVTNP